MKTKRKYGPIRQNTNEKVKYQLKILKELEAKKIKTPYENEAIKILKKIIK